MNSVLILVISTMVYFVLWAGMTLASSEETVREKKMSVILIAFILLIAFSITFCGVNGKVLYSETDLYIKGETDGYEVHSRQKYDECIEYGGQFNSSFHEQDSDEYLLYVSGYKSGYRKYRHEFLEDSGI